MALAGEDEGAPDGVAIDRLQRLVLVLPDYGEQVAEQAALLVAQTLGQLVKRGGAPVARRSAYLGVAVAVGGRSGAVARRALAVAAGLALGLAFGARAVLRRALLARPVALTGLGAVGRLRGGARRSGLLAALCGVTLYGCLRLARYFLASSRRAL